VGRDLGDGWKHVAAVRRGKELRLYIDGQLAANVTSEGSPLNISSDSPLQIGFGPQGYFDGRMREIRLYDRALSEVAVKAICDSSIGKTAQREVSKP
jgi:concanavalin A-like lectin/glucanase superfamily protein